MCRISWRISTCSVTGPLGSYQNRKLSPSCLPSAHTCSLPFVCKLHWCWTVHVLPYAHSWSFFLLVLSLVSFTPTLHLCQSNILCNYNFPNDHRSMVQCSALQYIWTLIGGNAVRILWKANRVRKGFDKMLQRNKYRRTAVARGGLAVVCIQVSLSKKVNQRTTPFFQKGPKNW